jgi:hypothetical protein
MDNQHNTRRPQKALGVQIMPQRAIGSFVRHVSKKDTSKGTRTYHQYWVYVPGELVEDKAFPFKPDDRLLITVTDGKLTLEKA